MTMCSVCGREDNAARISEVTTQQVGDAVVYVPHFVGCSVLAVTDAAYA